MFVMDVDENANLLISSSKLSLQNVMVSSVLQLKNEYSSRILTLRGMVILLIPDDENEYSPMISNLVSSENVMFLSCWHSEN